MLSLAKALCTLLVLIFSQPIIAQSANHQKEKSQQYIFFLHHRFPEIVDLSTPHPEYGRAEYHEILQTFRNAGFVVISEKRDSTTRVSEYATKIAGQIDSLMALGVKPKDITVIGASKGGYIAQHVSTYMANPDINYVFIGAFQERDIEAYPEIQFSGNILTIYDVGDFYGVSAIRRKETSKLKIGHFREVVLDMGIAHGFLYKNLPQWTRPCIEWAKGNYNFIP